MIGPSDILTALQNGVVAIRDLNGTIREFFPRVESFVTMASSTAAITFLSSQAQGYFTVTTSSGGDYKIPLY